MRRATLGVRDAARALETSSALAQRHIRSSSPSSRLATASTASIRGGTTGHRRCLHCHGVLRDQASTSTSSSAASESSEAPPPNAKHFSVVHDRSSYQGKPPRPSFSSRTPLNSHLRPADTLRAPRREWYTSVGCTSEKHRPKAPTTI